MSGDQSVLQTSNESRFAKWLPLLTELWIFGVMAAFLVIRILGSSTVKSFIHKPSH